MRKLFLIFFLLPTTLFAQTIELSDTEINQAGLDSLFKSQGTGYQTFPAVRFEPFVIQSPTPLGTRRAIYEKYKLNNERSIAARIPWLLVLLINRKEIYETSFNVGDTLYIPQPFSLDLRAYAPYPLKYEAAEKVGKLIVVNKATQTFGAYENGILNRWGMVVTGKEESPTPTGRYNVNWKQPARISTLSPALQKPEKGAKPSKEIWFLKYVINIHENRGIHFHQYFMPTSGPASHGCIRLGGSDARWLYGWTDGWETTVAADSAMVCSGHPKCKVKKQGNMVLVLNKDPKGRPSLFSPKSPNGLRMTVLPKDPYQVPAGTAQQTSFDRIRIAEARRLAEEERRRLAIERRKNAATTKPKPQASNKTQPSPKAKPKPKPSGQ